MIKRYHHTGLALFVPGVILQFLGTWWLQDESVEQTQALIALGVAVGGTLLAIAGLAFHARAKGQSPTCGLLGVMGIFGLIVQGSLKDESGDPWNT